MSGKICPQGMKSLIDGAILNQERGFGWRSPSMFSALYIQILRLSADKRMIVLALILLPFPVSIPLAWWLNRDGRFNEAQGKPSK